MVKHSRTFLDLSLAAVAVYDSNGIVAHPSKQATITTSSIDGGPERSTATCLAGLLDLSAAQSKPIQPSASDMEAQRWHTQTTHSMPQATTAMAGLQHTTT
jgi:hypothetical protein